MSKSKAKGTLAETAVVNYLKENGILAYRLPLTGTQDKGDILIPGKTNVTVEVKNCKTMSLSAWVNEAMLEREHAETDLGVVIHKRPRKGNPGDWYMTTTVDEFISILKYMGV